MKKTLLLAGMLVMAAMGANAQNLVENGDFTTPINEETYKNTPDIEEWFILNKTDGKTEITNETDDEKHGNTICIENTSDNVWYRAYAAKKISADKGVYRFSFEAKALSPNVMVRFFLRSANNEKLFFLRENFDVTDDSKKQQSGACFSSAIKKQNKWMKITTTFDLSKTIDNFYSIASVEKKGGEIHVEEAEQADLDDFVLVIQLQNKNSKVLIDNVSFTKVK